MTTATTTETNPNPSPAETVTPPAETTPTDTQATDTQATDTQATDTQTPNDSNQKSFLEETKGEKTEESTEKKEGDDKSTEGEYELPSIEWEEGFELNEEINGKFQEFLKENKVSKEAAQTLAGLAMEITKGLEASFKSELEKIEAEDKEAIASWRNQIESDPLFQGPKAAENKQAVMKGLSLIQDIEGVAELTHAETFGNHPTFVKIMHRIGTLISEDKAVSGGGGGNVKPKIEDILYPSMQKK